MSIVRAFDELRGRVVRLRKKRSLDTIASAMELTRTTLTSFLDGHPVSSSSLTAIEIWCDHQEHPHAQSVRN